MEIQKAIVVGDVHTNLIDPVTGKSTNYKEITTYFDGTPMTNGKVDGNFFRRKGSKYLRKVIDKDGELFLEKDTVAQIRSLTTYEILLLRAGVFKGVKLNGYYTKGDTPAPIEYYLSSTTEVDDAGSVFEVGGIKLEHKFKSDINVRYFGAKDDMSFDSTLCFKKIFAYTRNTSNISIYIPNGGYLLTDTLEPPSNIKIYGNGNNSILKFKHERFSISGSVKWMFKLTNQKNVTFENIKLHGGATTQQEFPHDVDGAEFLIYFNPISDGDVNNITINKVYFERPWSTAIQSYGRYAEPYPHPLTTNIRITDCYFTKCGDHGVGMNEFSNAIVSNCNFVDVGILISDESSQSGGGLAVDVSGGCEDVIITNNTVDGASGGFKAETHIKTDETQQQSKRIIISNNTIKNLHKGDFYKIFYGVRVAGNSCIVSNNVILNPQGHGVLISGQAINCTVEGNKIDTPLRTGIENGSLLGGSIIKGNTIINSSEQGITNDSNNTLIDGNIIINSGLTGIRNLGGDNILLSNNIVYNSKGEGISAVPTGSNVSRIVSIINNTCYDSRQGANRTQTIGIYADADSVLEVKSIGNTCYNNTIQDILLANSKRRNLEIGSNAVVSQTTNGLSTVGGNWNTGDRLINTNAVTQHEDPTLKYTLGWYNILDGGRLFIPYGFLGEYMGINNPNGLVSARVGSRYTEISELGDSSLWIKKNGGGGNTGWEKYSKTADASPDNATAPSATYTQAEVQSILTELRDLKTKLRTAGILAT